MSEFKNRFDNNVKQNLKLNKSASVVELTAARKILFMLNYVMRIDGDYLRIYNVNEDDSVKYSCYANEQYTKAELLGSIYIDEGTFSYTLLEDGTTITSRVWDQAIDYRDLIEFVADKLVPKHKKPSSSAIGHGRRQNDIIEGYHKILEETDLITWVEQLNNLLRQGSPNRGE